MSQQLKGLMLSGLRSSGSRLPRLLHVAAPILALLAPMIPGRSQNLDVPRGFPLSVANARAVGHKLALGEIISTDIGTDGSLFLIDYSTSQILKLSEKGDLVWRVGRRGGGPGEYQLPYRVVAMLDGSCLVYDLGTGKLTRLDSTGTFVSQAELEMRMLQVDNIVALSDGGLAISGVGQPRTSGDSAVHVFDQEFRYVRSFGALPPATSLQLRRQWGAGGLSVTSRGELVFTRRLPYEIYRYSAVGDLLGDILTPFDWKHRANDVIKITTDGARTVTSMNRELAQPGRAIRAGTMLISTHNRDGRGYLDFIDAKGTVRSMQLPKGWTGLVGYDEHHRVLWLTGEIDLEPALFRLELSSPPQGH